MKYMLLSVAIVIILLFSFFANTILADTGAAKAIPEVYVGIDAAYGDVGKIKELVNNVSSYTNLFVIGCRAITSNTSSLDEACQYLYDKGLYFIIFQEDALGRVPFFSVVPSDWTKSAKTRWGDHFLGFYYMDELGGKQIDQSSWSSLKTGKDYQDITNQYVARVKYYLDWFKGGYSDWTDVSLFTSDYALYWYDYKGGYDTVLAEYAWNNSRQLNTALCRGAASAQNKEWGAMVTWTYTTQPYIESGDELYKDMVYAYNNGAKYIVVFDSNKEYTQGILTEEHLNALKQFWNYIQQNPRENNHSEKRSAIVLPQYYGYSFRRPEEKVWGLWDAGNSSYALCAGINTLLEQYGTKLDIIYDDGSQSGSASKYSNLFYWNNSKEFSPVIVPTPIAIPPKSIISLLVEYRYVVALASGITAFLSTSITLTVLFIRRRLAKKIKK